jgi:hypothetical protein
MFSGFRSLQEEEKENINSMVSMKERGKREVTDE